MTAFLRGISILIDSPIVDDTFETEQLLNFSFLKLLMKVVNGLSSISEATISNFTSLPTSKSLLILDKNAFSLLPQEG